MTERLYLQDSMLYNCEATVLACEPHKDGYAVRLDRTVFFPNKGGQPCDVGFIGEGKVSACIEEGEELLHICDKPLEIGTRCRVAIDGERRFDIMQQHSGEHLLSWFAYTLFGYINVGFHCALDYATLDLDKPLTEEQLQLWEEKTNAFVPTNAPIYATIYDNEEELAAVSLRKHSEGLSGAVRVVTIEGADSCTCCAPHVKSSAQIGAILITQAIAYKGGMRVTFLCGHRAYVYAARQRRSMDTLARGFSTSQDKVVDSVEALKYQLSACKRQNKTLSDRVEGYVSEELYKEALEIKGSRLSVALIEDVDSKRLRGLAQAVLKTKGLCLLLCPAEGQLSYLLYSKGIKADMGEYIQAVNAILSGKGGGRGDMAQGRSPLPEGLKEIVEQLRFYLAQRLKNL